MLDAQKLPNATHTLGDLKPLAARSRISHFQTLKSQVSKTAASFFSPIISLNVVFVAEFYVDGSSIPDVDFDIGPSWAGLLPISGDVNETRQVRNLIFRNY